MNQEQDPQESAATARRSPPAPGTESRNPDRSRMEGVTKWWNQEVRSWWRVWLPGKQRQLKARVNGYTFRRSAGKVVPQPQQSVTAVLTVYHRGQYLADQIEALRSQTRPPAEIWVWSNDGDLPLQDYSDLADRVVMSNTNWSIWGRFAIGAMAQSDYLCIFDDDILPQPRWIENCLETYSRGFEGLLGGSGIILPTEGGYMSKNKVGWNGRRLDEPARVDLVGHAWFFRKEHLRYMWYETPYSWDNGEDIHFSYMLQKHGGLDTWVAPHPARDQSLWSSRPDFGKRVGSSSSAIHKQTDHGSVRSEIVDHCRANGWMLVSE